MKEINNIITSYDEARIWKESKPLWQRLYTSKVPHTEGPVPGC